MIRLIPGRNVVEDEDFDAVINAGSKDNPCRLQQMIDSGKIRVMGETVDITTMKVNDANDLVELESTEEGLLDLYEQESSSKKPRKTVIESIETKMDSIKKAAEEDPDGED